MPRKAPGTAHLSEPHRADTLDPLQPLALLAVAALEADNVERFLADAAELLSAAVGRPVGVVRGDSGEPVVELDAGAEELDRDRNLIEHARAVIQAAARRLDRRAEHGLPLHDEVEYRKVLDELPLITYVNLPGEGAQMGYVSPQAEAILGYPAEALLGPLDGYYDLVHPDDRERLREHDQRAIEGEAGEIAYRVRTADGHTVWLHDRSVPQLASDGSVACVRGFMIDITYEKWVAQTAAEAEQRFRDLIEEMPGVVYIDEPTPFPVTLYISPHIEEMLGYSPDEICADPALWYDEIVHPADREAALAFSADASQGIGRRSEFRCRAKDGRSVWISEESVPQLDESGNLIAVRGYILDITERKAAEAERAEAESEFRRLVEELPLVTYHETGGGELPTDYVSPQVEEILGYPPDRLTGPGERFYDLVHPDDLERTMQHTQRALAGNVVESEYRMFAADGRVVWLLDRSVPQFDGSGNVVKVRGFLLDITERKHVELERQAAEEEYRSLLEELPGVVYVDSAEERPSSIYLSPQIEELLGYPRDAWFADRDFFLDVVLHPDDRELVEDSIAKNGAGLRNATEYRCITKSGEMRWIYDESVPQLAADGSVVATRGFMLDITDQKLAEEELHRRDELLRSAQRMEAVGRLAGGIAHDFNNLLTVIKGHVDLLLSSERLDDQAREELAAVASAAERAAALIRQLLAFSRQQVLEPKVLHLGEIVSGLTVMLDRLLVERIALHVHHDHDLWPVRVDRSQVEQVVVNLVVNARDAMPEGGTISIETRNLAIGAGDVEGAPPGDYVALVVSDTGVGVRPEVQSRMFEPFFTTKNIGEGTGLGLATVYGIVEQSGGSITVESTPGSGAAFTILFPRVDATPTRHSVLGTAELTAAAESP